jgi:hypothetical protein
VLVVWQTLLLAAGASLKLSRLGNCRVTSMNVSIQEYWRCSAIILQSRFFNALLARYQNVEQFDQPHMAIFSATERKGLYSV